MSNSKLLFITPVAPPSPTGQGIILARLLETWPVENYCFLATQESPSITAEKSPATVYYLDIHNNTQKQSSTRQSLTLKRIKKIFSVPFQFVFLLKKILYITKKEKISMLICASGDPFNFPACALISKFKKIPLVLYLFDDYVYQWPQPFIRRLAKIIEKPCIKISSTLIVANEFLAQSYHERYNVQPVVIHNGLSNETIIATPKFFEVSDNTTIKIVYTGSIYYAHYDAFLNLISYMNQSGELIELHIYTAQDEQKLKKTGIVHKNVFYHPYLEQDKIQNIHQQANLLFLPLSFSPNYAPMITTSAPGKMAEYLASGVPVLAHTPPNSFVNWYCRNYTCALIADELSSSSLKNAIDIVRNNPKKLYQITSNAIERVKIDFSARVIDEKLKQTLLKNFKT